MAISRLSCASASTSRHFAANNRALSARTAGGWASAAGQKLVWVSHSRQRMNRQHLQLLIYLALKRCSAEPHARNGLGFETQYALKVEGARDVNLPILDERGTAQSNCQCFVCCIYVPEEDCSNASFFRVAHGVLLAVESCGLAHLGSSTIEVPGHRRSAYIDGIQRLMALLAFSSSGYKKVFSHPHQQGLDCFNFDRHEERHVGQSRFQIDSTCVKV